jgi:hypothetical protein
MYGAGPRQMDQSGGVQLPASICSSRRQRYRRSYSQLGGDPAAGRQQRARPRTRRAANHHAGTWWRSWRWQRRPSRRRWSPRIPSGRPSLLQLQQSERLQPHQAHTEHMPGPQRGRLCPRLRPLGQRQRQALPRPTLPAGPGQPLAAVLAEMSCVAQIAAGIFILCTAIPCQQHLSLSIIFYFFLFDMFSWENKDTATYFALLLSLVLFFWSVTVANRVVIVG